MNRSVLLFCLANASLLSACTDMGRPFEAAVMTKAAPATSTSLPQTAEATATPAQQGEKPKSAEIEKSVQTSKVVSTGSTKPVEKPTPSVPLAPRENIPQVAPPSDADLMKNVVGVRMDLGLQQGTKGSPAKIPGPITIKVLGQEVLARDVDFFTQEDASGNFPIHSFEVVNPITIKLARDNSIVASKWIFLDREGKLSMLMVPDEKLELKWKAADGRTLRMNCAQKSDSDIGAINRAVTFHPSGEYKGGCDALDLLEHTTVNGSKIQALGRLEFTEKFQLTYTNKVMTGDVKVGDQLIHIAPGSEINFHDNGKVSFFSMARGQKLTVDQPLYGKITVTQKSDRIVSSSFFEDGSLERGVVAEEFLHKHIEGLKISPDSGVGFDPADKSKLYQVVFAAPYLIKAKGYDLKAGRLFWDEKNGYYNINVTEAFVFVNPKDQTKIDVPAKSEVGLDAKTMEIIGIAVPRTGPPTM